MCMHHAVAFAMQAHHLLAPLVQLLQRLVTGVFFVHAPSNTGTPKSSFFIVPAQ